MRVFLRARGLSTSGLPPIINCRARRATTTTYANWLSGASLRTGMGRSASERHQNFANSIFVPRDAATRPERNGLGFTPGAVEVVVDKRKVIATIAQHLLPGTFEPAADFVL